VKNPLQPAPQSHRFSNSLYRDHIRGRTIVNAVLLRHLVDLAEGLLHLSLQPLVDFLQRPVVTADILDPLKVRNGHASCVAQEIGNDVLPILLKDLVGFGRRRSIGCFGNDPVDLLCSKAVSGSIPSFM